MGKILHSRKRELHELEQESAETQRAATTELRLKREEMVIVLLFLVAIFAFFVGPFFSHSVDHFTGVGYQAKDAYWHLAYEERILRDGTYSQTPPDLVNGYTNLVPIQPPWLYYTVAAISSTTGIAAHDVNQFFLIIVMLLSGGIVYVLARRVNLYVAIFSLPMMFITFVLPFSAGLLWGQHLFIAGMFFLIASVFCILNLQKWVMGVILAFFVAGMGLVHPSELGYFAVIGALVGTVLLIKREWKAIVILCAAVAFGVVLSWNYLWIFAHTWFANGEGSDPIIWNHIVSTGNFGQATVYYTHFGIWWYFILAGLILSVLGFITLKKHQELYAAFWGLFLIGFGTYLNQWRIYQYRFLWPIVLAFFFGLACFSLLNFVLKRSTFLQSRKIYVIGAVLIIMMSAIYTQYQLPDKFSFIDDDFYSVFLELQNRSSSKQEILFFDPGSSWDKAYWLIHNRLIYQAEPRKIFDQIQSSNTSTVIPVVTICEGVNYYKKNNAFVTATEVEKSCSIRDRSVCSFPFIVLHVRFTPPEYNPVIGQILSQKGVEMVYEKQGIILLTNLLVREEC